MKTNCRRRSLTFGEFIARIYDVCGERKAGGIVRLAIEAHWIEFQGQNRLVILEDFNLGAKP
jgi:hypothetical protein